VDSTQDEEGKVAKPRFHQWNVRQVSGCLFGDISVVDERVQLFCAYLKCKTEEWGKHKDLAHDKFIQSPTVELLAFMQHSSIQLNL